MPDQAAASLDSSLRALKTDHVDVWLMHAASADDLTNPNLLRFMERSVASGTIGTFGVGTDANEIPRIVRECPGFCRVLQFEWSVDDDRPQVDGFRIHHGAIGSALPQLQKTLDENGALKRRWSLETDRDLGDPRVLPALMLRAALEVNRDSVIIFFSRHIARIEENVAAAVDSSLRDSAVRLWELVREQADPAGGEA
jgi:diketogulonate reductase-like aldo/keto reductase